MAFDTWLTPSNLAIIGQIQEALIDPFSAESEYRGALLNCLNDAEDIQLIVNKLAVQGWTRRKFFLATYWVANEDEPAHPEALTDCIHNFLTAINGYCAPTAILKIPGEDTGGDLTAHARTHSKWLYCD